MEYGYDSAGNLVEVRDNRGNKSRVKVAENLFGDRLDVVRGEMYNYKGEFPFCFLLIVIPYMGKNAPMQFLVLWK